MEIGSKFIALLLVFGLIGMMIWPGETCISSGTRSSSGVSNEAMRRILAICQQQGSSGTQQTSNQQNSQLCLEILSAMMK